MVAPIPGFVDKMVEHDAQKRARTIDVTPTWHGLLPLLLTIYVDGTDEGRKEAFSELQRMAQAADFWNRFCKDKRLEGSAHG